MRFHHIAKTVKNIEESVAWHVENLSAKVLKKDDDWAMLLINGLSLALMLPDTHPEHIAFEVLSVDEFPCEKNEVRKHRDGSLYYYQEAHDGSIIEWLCWPDKSI